MLSSEFSYAFLSDITVRRRDRVRKEIKPESVASLAESISRLGLMHPLVVTREKELVAGETRLEAVRSLGWDHVPVQFVDTLSEKELLALELEENIKRSALTWQEECDAVLRFHQLQKEFEPAWTTEATATALGVSPRTVERYCMVAKEITAGNVRVADSKEFSAAHNIVQRKNERVAADQRALVAHLMDAPKPVTPFLCADFNEWAPTYTGPAFNFIHCDFPYGINADKFAGAGADNFGGYGGYDDTPEAYWKLIATLIDNRDRLLGESGHIIFWFSLRYYAETLAKLREFFWVDPYPLIWHKSDNRGVLPDPSRGPRRIYETAFLCSYGDRKIVTAVSNVFAAPAGERIHMSEKAQPMLEHFLRMVCDSETRMLDPTAGSGSSLRAARALGVTNFLGLELNSEFVASAKDAWNDI